MLPARNGRCWNISTNYFRFDFQNYKHIPHKHTEQKTTQQYPDKPVSFYGPIVPPVLNAPELRSLHATAPPVQSEYPTERRAAAAVPLPESP